LKQLWNILVLTLALNFVLVAGTVAYLHQTGRLTPAKVQEVKAVLFPPPAQPQAATQPAVAAVDPATTQPVLRLEHLLAQQSGRPATEQIEFIRHSFDAQMAHLDRRQRELADLQRQVEAARQQLARDREQLGTERAALAAREEEAARLASDQGFQDSLELYNSLPPKQVKTIFMTLDDRTVTQYLRAMQPRTAARVVKEFKTPDELARAQRVLELMRQAEANAAAAAAAAGASPKAAVQANGR
jgi:hypothetical protein